MENPIPDRNGLKHDQLGLSDGTNFVEIMRRSATNKGDVAIGDADKDNVDPQLILRLILLRVRPNTRKRAYQSCAREESKDSEEQTYTL